MPGLRAQPSPPITSVWATSVIDRLSGSPFWWVLFAPCALLCVLTVLVVGQGVRDVDLGNRQRVAEATVTAHDPINHLYGYAFSDGRRFYSGSRNRVPPVPLEVGQKTPVFYDPASPGENALSSFTVRGWNNLLGAAWLLAILAIAFGALPFWLRRRALASNNQPQRWRRTLA